MELLRNQLAKGTIPGHHKHHTNIFDADWNLADQHYKASKVGFSSANYGNKICQCCLELVNKQQIPLNQNTKQLEFLGFGFPLYFSFVRNCIFLLIVSICSYNLIALHTALTSNHEFCHSSQVKQLNHPHKNHYYSTYQLRHHDPAEHKEHRVECTSWMVDVARVEKTVTLNEQLHRIVSFAIHLILLIYIRDKLIKLKQYFDERTASPSDYSLMLKDIPHTPGMNVKGQIKAIFGQDLKNNKIQQIVLIPDLHEFEELEEKKKEQIEKLRILFKKGQHQSEQAKTLQQEIHHTELKITNFIYEQKKLERQNKLEANKAIVIMSTEPDKEQALQMFQKKGFSSNWKQARLSEAPEPRELIWENISLPASTKFKNILIGWLLSLLVLVVLTVLFAFVSKKKSSIVQAYMEEYRQHHNSGDQIKAYAIVFAMISFVVLFNKLVIANLFHKFTDMQRHSTTYKFQFSFCLKYCLGLFFTTALMTLIVQAFMLKNYFKHDFGVVEQETIMYFVNSIFVPLFWIINPVYLYKQFKSNLLYGSNCYTQKQANQIMEPPGYDVGKRYGQVLEIVWFTFLYMTLIPIGGLISCLGLVAYYWIDKYNLLRRSSLHSYVSGDLINLTMSLLDFTLVLRCFGQIIFDYQIRDGIRTYSWLCLCVALIYQILPVQQIIGYLNQQNFKSEQKQYKDIKQTFKQTYYDEHVLYSYLEEDRHHLAHQLTLKLVQHILPTVPK